MGIEEKNGAHNGNVNYAHDNTITGNTFSGRKNGDVVLVGSEIVCLRDVAVAVCNFP